MYPEKPKNKAKRGTNSRLILILAGVILIIMISGASFILFNQPTIMQLNNVMSVRIRDSWAGLSPASPINSTYTLSMVEGTLHGSAAFSVGYETDIVAESTITIPPEVVTAFLEKLEEAQLSAGVYTPSIEWTDDYPMLGISVEMPTGTVEIYSQSQGEEHIPWGATVNGNDYTINSGIPAEALALLEPYLHRDVLQGLIDEAISRP